MIQVKWVVFRHFRDNVWEEWAEICHVHLYLVISPEMKKANFSTWKSFSYRPGVSLTTVQSDFSSFLILSPYKTITFHNTTKGGCLSGRIISIILLMYNQILYDNKQPKLCFEARRKCGVGFIQTQLASSYANAPQPLASSFSTVGFIARDFHAQISRQHSQTNLRSLHTLFLTSESRCMQKISSVDALLTIQNVLSWSGRFGGGHTGWSQLQLASSVSPLCC